MPTLIPQFPEMGFGQNEDAAHIAMFIGTPGGRQCPQSVAPVMMVASSSGGNLPHCRHIYGLGLCLVVLPFMD
jgi:hypothetical protein